MIKQRKFAVDLSLTGTVIVKTRNRNEAIRRTGAVDINTMIDCIENNGFGKDYAEEI
jgi:hypothetical protein